METLGINANVSDESYAEALRIAQEANANQHTFASTPGGLTPSIQKVQIVELLSTGASNARFAYTRLMLLREEMGPG